VLARRIEEIRQAKVFGVRPAHLWREAATRYLTHHAIRLRSSRAIADHLAKLDPFIGALRVDQVSATSLQPFVAHELGRGISHKSINLAIGHVRRILNLAASEWTDPLSGQTWLAAPPKLVLLPLKGFQRQPYPISWEEQDALIRELPGHLQRMVLFAINTGAREQEICKLSWEWEVKVPELKTSVFIVPESVTKAGVERLLVLNAVARSIVESQRGQHRTAVFTFRPRSKREKPARATGKINNTAWKKARVRAGVPCRVHDLRHTFTRRLRAAGVSLETRRALLGHASGDLTTHYSAAELAELIAAVETIATRPEHETPMLTVLRSKAG
jgi:integrase